MAEKSAQEKLFYKDVLRYLTERSYREEAEKQWKRTIRRKAQSTMVSCILRERMARKLDVGFLMRKIKKE